MEPNQVITTKNVRLRPAYNVGWMAVRIVAAYVVVAALWILVSDRLLTALVKDADSLMRLEIVKGWVFIAVTAVLLFVLLRGESQRWNTERATREEAQLALRESEARFRQLFDLAPQPLGFYRLDGVPVTFNRRFEQVLGYAPSDIPTIVHWQLLAHPDESERRAAVARWEAAVAQAIKNNTDIEPDEYKITCKNGEVRTFLLSGSLMHAGVLTVFFDITERKNADAALRESQRQPTMLAGMLAHASQPFCAGYADGRLDLFNTAFTKLLGYTEAELRAMNWTNGLTPPEWEKVESDGLAELNRTGQPVRYEKELLRKDGTRVPVELLVHQVCTEAGKLDFYYAFITDLTIRRQTEAALRKSEERLKFAMEGANEGIWDVDMRTETVELSPRGCEMFGYTPDEFRIGMPLWSTMVHPDDLAVSQAELQNHLCGRTPLFEVEQRIRTKSGEFKWILARGKISGRDATGTPIRMTGTHADIGPRKQAETRIRHLNRVYAVLSAINQTIVRMRGPQAIFAEASHIAVERGGFLMAWIGLVETTPERVKIGAHAGASAEVLQILESVIGRGECGITVQTLRAGSFAVCNDIANDQNSESWRKEAVRFGYRSMASFPLKSEGKTIGTFNFYAGEKDFFDADELRLLDELASDLSFAVEVCEREERRRRIEASNTRLATAVEQADETIMITGVDAEILYVNPAFEKASGYTAQEALGRNPRFLQSGMHDKAFYAGMWAKLTRGEVWSGRIINKRKDGTRYEEKTSISPVRDATGRIVNYVGVKLDVTQEVAMEARLRQTQKMEAIGTLAGGIAHDFNNVLGAISGYAELAKMEVSSPTVQDGLAEILRACRRASDLVRQILTFSQRQEQHRRTTQLWPVVEEAAKLLRAALPSTIEFHLEHAQDVPPVLADPTQVHQVVMNLCTNAAYAMKGRTGRLEVKLEKFEVGEEFAQLHPGGRPGIYALLTVRDNGLGMDRGTLDRIFEPFFTTKPPGEGTGLGLAVVHGIVQNHDGLITVYSQPGTGTVFNVYLPAHDCKVAEQSVPSESILVGHGQRIFVVDDEPPLAQMTGKIIQKLGYTAETATDPIAALATLRAAPKKFDLIITDLTMPGMTGLEFAAGVMRENSDLKVILMTGYAANLSDEQLRSVGIHEVVPKPMTIKALSQVIDRLLKT